MKYDKAMMAKINRKNVLDTIRKNGPIGKAEVSKTINLSLPTVMKITEEFKREGLIKVVGKGDSSGGKRPELLEIIPNAFYMIGVDMGRSRTISIIMNMEGKAVYKKTMKTGKTNPPSGLLARVTTLIKETIKESNLNSEIILGIGVVTPGLIDVKKGRVIYSPDFQWENVDMISFFEKEIAIPLKIDNSNRAMALGEGWFGAASQGQYFICLNFGHGIGSAIMEKGRFYRGTSGSSGEIGHITLNANGPICECGNKGCLEAIASGNAIAGQAKERIKAGRKTMITKIVNNDLESLEAIHVFAAAKAGDPLANEIINQAIEYIGIGVANYINLLDPDLIVLAGGMVKAGGFFVDRVIQAIKQKQMKFAGSKVQFKVTKLNSDAAAIGAASLILRKFIEQGGIHAR